MKYLEKVREMERHFKGYSVQHIPRDDNNEADKLAKAATRNQEMPPDVCFEIIKEPSIKKTKPKIMNFLQCTHRHKGSSRQSNKVRILLAYHKHRCKEIGSGI
jgi:hypothetical protein